DGGRPAHRAVPRGQAGQAAHWLSHRRSQPGEPVTLPARRGQSSLPFRRITQLNRKEPRCQQKTCITILSIEFLSPTAGASRTILTVLWWVAKICSWTWERKR